MRDPKCVAHGNEKKSIGYILAPGETYDEWYARWADPDGTKCTCSKPLTEEQMDGLIRAGMVGGGCPE